MTTFYQATKPSSQLSEHEGLVNLVVGKFVRQCPGLEWFIGDRDDLKQEAYIAVLHAVEHYKPDSTPFVNYCFWCIWRRLQARVWYLGPIHVPWNQKVKGKSPPRYAFSLAHKSKEAEDLEPRWMDDVPDECEMLLRYLEPLWRTVVYLVIIQEMTQREVGAELGLSHNRVGQILKKSLRLLRNRCEQRVHKS